MLDLNDANREAYREIRLRCSLRQRRPVPFVLVNEEGVDFQLTRGQGQKPRLSLAEARPGLVLLNGSERRLFHAQSGSLGIVYTEQGESGEFEKRYKIDDIVELMIAIVAA